LQGRGLHYAKRRKIQFKTVYVSLSRYQSYRLPDVGEEGFRKELFSDQHEAKDALSEQCKADAMKKAYKVPSLSELLGVRAATEEGTLRVCAGMTQSTRQRRGTRG
jgi:hypothetical protein